MQYREDREHQSTDKYLYPTDYSLAGKTFVLAMDDGETYTVRFLTGEALMWAKQGEPFRWEKYACLESEESSYFVVSYRASQPVRTCIALVLDTEQSLVTACYSRQGYYPKRPRLVKTDFIFGAIQVDGQPLPIKRHCFTSDLNGKQITWRYSSGFLNTHLYIDSNYYRIRPIRQAFGQETEGDSKDPLFEEPSSYIKIKDGMYLISFIENNLNKYDPLRGGNNLIVLTNEKKMFDVGRTFCLNKEQKPDGGVFIAYGEVTDEYVELAHLPSPYRV